MSGRKIFAVSLCFYSVFVLCLDLQVVRGQSAIESNKSMSNQMQLIQTPKISVTVTGAVKYPGTYTMNVTDRVDKAIQLANEYDVLTEQGIRLERTYQYELELLEKNRYSPTDVFIPKNKEKPRRNILVYRSKGIIVKADIQKYYACREEKWNPFLLDGDIVFVPRYEEKKNLYAVYGGVNVPGQIEYSEGDRITDAIELAYGFISRARIDSIVLYRYNEDNTTLKEQIIRWSDLKSDEARNIKLHPGDRIIVPEYNDLREDYYVTISGEVHFPGVYPITREKTKLSEIIQKAGGITGKASLKSASVYRYEIDTKDYRIEQILTLRGNTFSEDTSNFIIENEIRLNRGVVNVDFEKLIEGKDDNQDILLQTGDIIVFPSILKTVYVYGQVITPGSVPFIDGESVEYYIKKAGGYTDHSRSSDVMIIKRGSRQWLLPSETRIDEGDYIWVPKDPDKPFSYYLNIVGQAASIISVAVSIILLTLQVNK